ncbi:DNA replication protein psf1 [Cystobasidiomycetes sp. EMM_F5]
MIGDAALALVQDTSRSQQTSLLRPYLDEPVRQLARETRSLGEQLQAGQEVLSQIENDDASVCGLTVAALTMRRNKRAMLLYHSHRLDLLRDLLWDAGIGSGASNMAGLMANTSCTSAADEVRRNLSPPETDFLRAYANLVREYKSAYIDAVDLSAGSLDLPPKELHCQVRVLRDIGDIETEQGSISFRKGSLVFVRRADVDRLIANGSLEEVL